MVIYRNLERVAAASPVNRVVSVTRFGNRAYVADLDVVCVRLSENGFADVFSCADVCFLRSVGLPVSGRRNHSAYVQNVVCARDGVKHVLILCKVAPDDSNGAVGHKALKLFTVLCAVAK